MMVYDSTALQLTLQAKPLCYLLAELELSSVSNSKLSYRRDRLEIAPKISIDAELDPSFAAMSVSGAVRNFGSHTSPPECREGRHSTDTELALVVQVVAVMRERCSRNVRAAL